MREGVPVRPEIELISEPYRAVEPHLKCPDLSRTSGEKSCDVPPDGETG
jgi:hypothetical protein